jgi:hypothetical protein
MKEKQGNKLTCHTHQRDHNSAALKEQVENTPLENKGNHDFLGT